jgi:hypothetical protein
VATGKAPVVEVAGPIWVDAQLARRDIEQQVIARGRVGDAMANMIPRLIEGDVERANGGSR